MINFYIQKYENKIQKAGREENGRNKGERKKNENKQKWFRWKEMAR